MGPGAGFSQPVNVETKTPQPLFINFRSKDFETLSNVPTEAKSVSGTVHVDLNVFNIEASASCRFK